TISKFENVLKKFLLLLEKDKKKELRVLNKTGNEPKDKKKWKNQVNQALERIEDGELEKVVLSRKVELIFTTDVSVEPILKNLVDNYPECTSFIYHKGKSSFIGASPETLANISRSGMELEVLAGSAVRGDDENEDLKFEHELIKNDKELNEHNIVVNYVKNCLEKSVESLEISRPSVKKLKNIQHIKTTIKLDLNEHSSSIGIIGKIHPTPAVCGLPGETALNMIKKLENHQRGLYSGLIGWFNFKDEGELILAIRSALINGNKLIAYAGCGIVRGSNADAEFKETELKLKPFLSIFNNEN
ncbi:MAG TPA: isochorismate synthase, partial [Ignavibacteriaceae bacterium]|nr:isochorismate synthase [Ignavibacteriaceae bacterium]